MIAKRTYGDAGQFTSIDDSGGGSGVEFYLTRPNGAVWGWQAKFFYPGARLSKGGRKEQIKKSLQRSFDDHPTLEKWFLCTPENLTPGEIKWVQNKLSGSIKGGKQVLPETSDVDLIHWGKSEFISLLSKEHCAGIQRYFFGELELSRSWFETVYQRAEKSPAGKRYMAKLHSNVDVSPEVYQVTINETFIRNIENDLAELEDKREVFYQAIEDVEAGRPSHFDWNGSNTEILEKAKAEGARKHIDQAVKRIRDAVASLRRGDLDLSSTLGDTRELTEGFMRCATISKE